MGLKELLAAKKAAAAASAPAPAPALDDPLAAMGLSTAAPETPVQATVEAPIQPEPPVSTPQKPMTFAERMALKKQQAAASTPAPPVPAPAPEPPAPKQPVEVKLSEAQLEVIEAEDNKELAQAYSDLALLINHLQYTDEGDSLQNAMSELKKALKQNPSASMLLLDTDIGQMTIALRRLTQEHLEEAPKKAASTGGKKAKAPKASVVPLSADDIANALADM